MDASVFMKYKNWVVVGDVLNNEKYAYRILSSLKSAGYNVKGVNPREKDKEVYKTLSEIPYSIDVVDLCIRPEDGIKIIKEAARLHIDKVLIQPGAESDEIVEFADKKNILAIEGCALVELSRHKII